MKNILKLLMINAQDVFPCFENNSIATATIDLALGTAFVSSSVAIGSDFILLAEAHGSALAATMMTSAALTAGRSVITHAYHDRQKDQAAAQARTRSVQGGQVDAPAEEPPYSWTDLAFQGAHAVSFSTLCGVVGSVLTEYVTPVTVSTGKMALSAFAGSTLFGGVLVGGAIVAGLACYCCLKSAPPSHDVENPAPAARR